MSNDIIIDIQSDEQEQTMKSYLSSFFSFSTSQDYNEKINSIFPGFFEELKLSNPMIDSTLLSSYGTEKNGAEDKGFTDGMWLWTESAGGTRENRGFDVAVDANGNVYVTGFFKGTTRFGEIILTSEFQESMFVAKLNTAGVWEWAKNPGGTSRHVGYGVAIDANDNVYVTGIFAGTATFGDTTLTKDGLNDMFIAKLNSNGVWQWTRSAGGTGLNSASGIDVIVDASGNIYVTGFFQGAVRFGTATFTSQGDSDMFVAKLSTNGAWLWAVGAGGTSDDWSWGVAVDDIGNVYVTGSIQGTARFGTIMLASQGRIGVFVAKLSTNGAWLWAVGAGGRSNDEATSVAVDDIGNVYITGYFRFTATFGDISITSQGGGDVFVAKLSTGGVWLWAESAGGPREDWGYGVAVDANGNRYVSGFFHEAAWFGTTRLISQGESDVFVSKMSSNNPPLIPVVSGPSRGKTGESYTYSAVTTDPEGDQIYYLFEWGDGSDTGWLGSFNSGGIIEQSYVWQDSGEYLIRVKAKDQFNAESSWATLEATMPKLRDSNLIIQVFLRMIERFPVLEHLVRL